MSDPHAILHIGAPKCGSSALQTALTGSPDHAGASGRPLRYVGCRHDEKGAQPFYGWQVRLSGRVSPYGYVSWPDLMKIPPVQAEAIWGAMERAIRTGARKGHVPILSSEAWISHPAVFGARLADWNVGPVDVVAFVRPPLEWLNAAYWQWGIWSGLPFSKWYPRSRMAYRFGEYLEAWASLPGVTLSVRDAKQDAVRGFADLYGLTLPPAERRNSGVSAPLAAFLFRNRRFRSSAHDAATEFVVQRWCPPIEGPRPWALKPKDFQMVRRDVAQDMRRLLPLFEPVEAERIRADPHWTQGTVYHDRIIAGNFRLLDTMGAPALFTALVDGVHAVSAVLGRKSDLPTEPSRDADLESWDAALSRLMETLLEGDRQVRWSQGFGLPARLGGPLVRTLGGLSRKGYPAA